MRGFFHCLLKFYYRDSDNPVGVLGRAASYYGCVETQGRGSLHCHMLVWLQGSFNPNVMKDLLLHNNEFKEELICYLDHTLSSTHHPCSICGAPIPSEQGNHDLRANDIHHLAEKCQHHYHSDTCYKYKTDTSTDLTCRFDLDPSNHREQTIVDSETGSLMYKHLDGMAMRCNMDIKFVGSGTAAKAVLYYITDYITNTLEIALGKLNEFDPRKDDLVTHSKNLIHNSQELPLQFISACLLGHNDHYFSHPLQSFFWFKLTYTDTYDHIPDVNGGEEVSEERDIPFEVDSGGAVVCKPSFMDDYCFRPLHLENCFSIEAFTNELDR
ncbi:hypothetical protein BJ165DRAFT_1413057 [Panaeolus papilionaceus]|nr:hypothetical protein BJ165DRAFT_1413057 [Panaeolus papilionaceus]